MPVTISYFDDDAEEGFDGSMRTLTLSDEEYQRMFLESVSDGVQASLEIEGEGLPSDLAFEEKRLMLQECGLL